MNDRTIWEIFEKTALKFENNEFCYFPNEKKRITWAQAKEYSLEVASSLNKLGIGKGERVAICGQNCYNWVAFFLACSKIGAISILLSSKYNIFEMDLAINKSNPDILVLLNDNIICESLFKKIILNSYRYKNLKNIICINNFFIGEQKKLQCKILGLNEFLEKGNSKNKAKFLQIKPEDELCVFFTSGTNGNPKTVSWTNNRLIKNLNFIKKIINVNSNDIFLISTPLYHLAAMNILLLGIKTGNKLILPCTFSTTHSLSLINNEKVTLISGVPSVYNALLYKNQHYHGSIKKAVCAGDYADDNLIKEFIVNFDLEKFYNDYGASEFGCICITKHKNAYDLSQFGTISSAIEVKLDENKSFLLNGNIVNEILVKSNKNDLKWLKTGDLGIISKNKLKVLGRIKDIIIKGGENISSNEIERVIKKNVKIKNVKVFGIPDKFYGEEICVCIEYGEKMNLTRELIEDIVLKNLSKQKVPKKIIFLKSFPMLPAGKIDALKLKNMVIYNEF